MKKLLMLTAAALVISAPAAFAEHDGKPHKGGWLEKLDADKDGNVTKAEFLAFHEARFAEADTNGDGVISKDEAEAKKAEWKAKRKEMHKGEAPVDAPAEAPAAE